ncbi:MAG: hypothetical protein WBB18_12510, partial [Nodosilinea sp.]
MDTASDYWQQVQLDSSGRDRVRPVAPLKDWLTANFAPAISQNANPTKTLQPALWAIYKAQKTDADRAQHSLRCYISHQTKAACVRLVSKFGRDYGFTLEDILPLVLDDERRRASSYRPLSLKILDTYNPDKAQLATWTARLISTHPEVDRALLERGLHRATDWSLLNGTTPEQLGRILRDYHRRSNAEIAAASLLLGQYRQVYLRDRLAQRRSGRGQRCQPPSEEQLRRMAAGRPEETLMQLQDLAALLREYRIGRRKAGSVATTSDIDWNQVPDTRQPADEDDQERFLATYRQALRQGLDQALAYVIQANIGRLQKRRPPKERAYVKGLQLFYCEDLSMGRLAPQIGLSSQVQVTRLLQLQRLRADVRHWLIPYLCDRVQAEVLKYLSADRLEQINQGLEQLLTE